MKSYKSYCPFIYDAMFDYDKVVPEGLRETLRSMREMATEKRISPCHRLNDKRWPYICTKNGTELDVPMLSAYCLTNPEKCVEAKSILDLI